MRRHKNRPVGCGNTTTSPKVNDLHENKNIIAHLKLFCKGGNLPWLKEYRVIGPSFPRRYATTLS